MKSVAGIDISKLTLDVCFDGKAKTFSNDKKGFGQFIRWCKGADLVVMEATGSYHCAFAQYLCASGLKVAVVNPAMPLYFARSLGRRNKTDKVDASTLVELGRSRELPLYVPPSVQQTELTQMVRLRVELVDERARLKSRIQTPGMGSFELELMNEQIKMLSSQLKRVEARIMSIICEVPELAHSMELLTSIPGVGNVTAWTFLGEVRGVEVFDSAKELASFLGVCPLVRQSGTSLMSPGRISRQGNRAMRKALYMAAVGAIKTDGVFKQFFKRLVQHGKRPKVAIVAVMHKLLRVIYGVLKRGCPFIQSGP